jgi:hypothetical protein
MTTINENAPGKPEGVITSPPATCSVRWVNWEKSPKKTIAVQWEGVHPKYPYAVTVFVPSKGRMVVPVSEIAELVEAPNESSSPTAGGGSGGAQPKETND